MAASRTNTLGNSGKNYAKGLEDDPTNDFAISSFKHAEGAASIEDEKEEKEDIYVP
jgi:hypothetical protein